MAYNATYDGDDIAPAVIDAVVTGLVIVVSFATLIVLVMIYNWLRKNVK